MPRFVVSDLPSRAACAGMVGVGAVWLGGRMLTAQLWRRDPAQQSAIAICSGRVETVASPTRLGF